MRFTELLPALAALLLPAVASAQSNAISVTTSDDAAPRTVTVEALTDNIIRVTNTPRGVEAPKSATTVTPKGRASVEYLNTPGARVMVTKTGVVAAVNPLTGALTISAGSGRTVTDDAYRQTDSLGVQTLKLKTTGTTSWYGAGERGYSLNLAGDTLVMFNKQNYGYTAGEPRIKQMNITMPLLLSSDGYAILFDDYAEAQLVAGNPLEYTTIAPQPVSWYFINGDGDMTKLIREVSSLTGRQELPPLWALGYITSKYGYHTEAETRGVVDTLKRAGYPLDGIVLDLYWYGKEQDMGRLAWDPEQWPSHAAMLADLKKQGVNLVAISQPYVLRNGKGIDNYNYLAPRGMLAADNHGNQAGEVKIWVGEGGMLDVSNPETRTWLRDRYKALTDGGITGWWGDLGEPEVHPDSLVHHNGLTARQYHNLYGNDWSQIIYDLFKDEYPDTRLMTMMRGGTVGLQRYSVYPWSTDVSRSWGGLQPQITIMTGAGLSGLGYMSHDVGGFAVDPEHPYDPELYVRWLQLGLFSPILRTHAQQFAEPYNYPEQQDIILPLIKERYAWLPYNYTLAFENASQGLPLVRPAGMYETGMGVFDEVSDEYLWGHDVLVAPVVKPGATSREVFFPEGEWLLLSDPSKKYEGGSVATVDAPLNVLPLFVRNGAMLPRADYEMANTGDYRTDRYRIDFYPTIGTSDGYIYEDDMTTPTTLEQGRYALIRYKAQVSADEMRLNVATELGSEGFRPAHPVKELTFVLHNVEAKPKSVTVDGRKAKYTYDAGARTLTFTLTHDIEASNDIVIK